jgi:hypothetical protein
MEGASRARDAGDGKGAGNAVDKANLIDRSFNRAHQNIKGMDQLFRGWRSQSGGGIGSIRAI